MRFVFIMLEEEKPFYSFNNICFIYCTSGFILRTPNQANPNTTLMTVIFQFDIKGWLPSVLRTLFQSDYFLAQTTNVFMNGIRRCEFVCYFPYPSRLFQKLLIVLTFFLAI
jgi:hypothetical protein